MTTARWTNVFRVTRGRGRFAVQAFSTSPREAQIVVVAGDGIGPEVRFDVQCTLSILFG